MDANCFRTAAIYRKFDDELLVVQLETGYFFYFTPHTKTVFDFFAVPQTLEAYFMAAGIAEEDALERKYLENFLGFLTENNLLAKCPPIDEVSLPSVPYHRPKLLRRSDNRIDDIARSPSAKSQRAF